MPATSEVTPEMSMVTPVAGVVALPTLLEEEVRLEGGNRRGVDREGREA